VVEHHKPVLARGSVTGSQSIAAVRPLKLGEAGYRYVTYVDRAVDQAEQCWSLSTEPRANRSTVHTSPSRYPASIVADNCRYRLLDHGMRGRKLGHSASVAFPRRLNSHIHLPHRSKYDQLGPWLRPRTFFIGFCKAASTLFTNADIGIACGYEQAQTNQ
jgi:hypothetical protein